MQGRFRFVHERGDAFEFLNGFLLRHAQVGKLLRETRPALGQLGEGLLLGGHDAEYLQSRHEAVTGGVVVTENQVAALFAAEIIAVLQHGIDHVLVAHGRAHGTTAGRLDGGVEAGIAHDGGHEGIVSQ